MYFKSMPIGKARHLFAKYLEQQHELGLREIDRPAPAENPPPLTGTGEKAQTLEELERSSGACHACPLAESRTRFVFGSGDAFAQLMFVGEAPGEEEDRQGKPFVGAAGQLLTKMIEAMGFTRNQIYIANILKCRPPKNRTPLPEEIAVCFPILRKQIEIIQPKFICALGLTAARALLGSEDSLSKLRGRFYDVMGAKLIPTYHPSALLRNPEWKRPAWEDLQLLMKEMGLPSKV